MNILSRNGWRVAGLGLLAGVMALLAFVAPTGLWAAGDTVIVNGDFENGTSDWKCKLCNLDTGSPAQSGAAAQMTTTRTSGRAQLMQNNITLQPNTTYELKFWAQSNQGEDLQVTLLKQTSPYTNYGIKPQNFNVTQSGQEFTITFTTTGFSQPVSNARLRFRADKGKGKVYSIDSVSLAATDGEPPPPPPPSEEQNEILIFNRGSKSQPFSVTKSMSGFIMDQPPTGAANANWVTGQYAGFADGTVYYRARIISIPQNQPGMKLGFCFWENKFVNEECRGQVINGIPGTEMTWSHKLDDMWVKSPINWANPRTKHGFIVRNAKNDPVSAKKGWNWNGENPDHWYPMEIHYTAVLVKTGGEPDWTKYGW